MRFGAGIITTLTLAGVTALACVSERGQAAPKAAPADNGSFQRQLQPLVKKYCLNCHSGAKPPGEVALAGYRDGAAVLKGRATWERVVRMLKAGTMPPQGLPQPSMAERERMVAWLESTFSKADCDVRDPGRVTMRRLNRAEYNNTVRDLFGMDLHPADEFPSDDVGYGFDNIGDVLSISPLLMEKYLSAAEKVSQAVIVAGEPQGRSRRFEGEGLNDAGGQPYGGHARILASTGEVGVTLKPRDGGDYLLRARAFGQQAGPEPAKMAFRIDGKDLRTVDVTAVESRPGIYQTRVHLDPGQHRFAVAFTNDYYKPDDPNPENRDRNLVIEHLEVVGPLEAVKKELPETHRRILFEQPQNGNDRECARKILAAFARRAYRRPATAAEVERLVGYVDMAVQDGESFERGIQIAVQAALCSPNFLFRVETDPKPGDKTAHPVNDWELASRLSYFLWSSMPDDALFSLAEQGKLHEPKVLQAQAERMLKDPKAHALVEDFADQWLTLRNLKGFNPDPKRFPGFNDALRADMLKETELFFESVMREDHSVLDFLDAKYTFLDERLAKHYGIDGVKGDEFRKVALTGDQRGGLLTQGSILAVTSNPTRTSPVKRGKWVMEQILGTPPPPPPPGVPKLLDDQGKTLTGTLRQRMEQHRKDPGCASCHAQMDPLGFGLENFDAVGAWRAKDGDAPVDASGSLPDGRKFNGPAGLKKILMGQKELFVHNLSQQLLTYGLGRGLEWYDRCAVDQIAADTAKGGYHFTRLVDAIVTSEPFRMRRGEGQGAH